MAVKYEGSKPPMRELKAEPAAKWTPPENRAEFRTL